MKSRSQIAPDRLCTCGLPLDAHTRDCAPGRACCCGLQSSGRFLAECPNDRAWRLASYSSTAYKPHTQEDPAQVAQTCRAKLVLEEDHLAGLLCLRDAAREAMGRTNILTATIHNQRNKIKRLRSQIALAEAHLATQTV
jgi:hypothetical protein